MENNPDTMYSYTLGQYINISPIPVPKDAMSIIDNLSYDASNSINISELPHNGIKEFLNALYHEIDLIQTRSVKGYELMDASACKEKVLELIKNKIDNIRED